MNAWDRFALTPRHDSMDTVRDADKEIRRKHEVRLSGDTRDAPVRDKAVTDLAWLTSAWADGLPGRS